MSELLERCKEIDRWYEDNPDPSTLQAAERLIPLRCRRVLNGSDEDLSEVAGYLHDVWIGDALTLRQAAEIAIPAVHDRLMGQDRAPEMKAWMVECFFDHGLERETAERIFVAHQQTSQAGEGAA